MFRQQIIKMHIGSPLLENGEEFGILEIEMEKADITDKPTCINIMLDKSGSMDEGCEDGNSKMDQIKHVVTNMLRYVSSNCLNKNVSVNVKTFNSRVENVINDVILTEENLQETISSLKKIYPEDNTNIELALKSMHKPTTEMEQNNIFMSDGDANDGETRPEELAKMIDTRAANYVVGFGLEHNPKIFAALSNKENSSYYFIDKIEKSAVAYGEILHEILHKSLKSVKISVQNGLIYDWRTNQWMPEIFVGRMSGEMKKTFHVKTTNKMEMEITLRGHSELHGEIVYKYHGNEGEEHDLTKMFYRQRTQEILYKVKKINERSNVPIEEVRKMKKEMKVFMAEMMEYMKKTELTEDRIMKNLCDDIVIVYRTLGTEYGFMYSCARQESNGTERTHTASDTPMPKAPKKSRKFNNSPMGRQCSVMPCEYACNEEEDEYDKYSLSRSNNCESVFDFESEERYEKEERDEMDEFMLKHETSPTYCTQELENVINSLNKEEEDA